MAKKKKMRGGVKVLLLLVILGILIGAASSYWQSINAPVVLAQDVTVTIDKGSSTPAIAEKLATAGVINNAKAFTYYVKQQDAGQTLRSGDFVFAAGELSHADVLAALQKNIGKENTVNITIPEGLRITEFAKLLEEKNIASVDEVLNYAAGMTPPYDYITNGNSADKLEGFLFPETYNIMTNWGAKEIIDMQLAQFDKVFKDEWRQRADEMGLSIYEVVTIASLIEKEAKVAAERPLIASVIYNRLDSGMLLQIDATVQYALGEAKSPLLYKDLEIDSPYNTYIYKGLPKGPIAAPGASCIEAALYPADTEYYYYRTKDDGSGEHYFSKTYEEHLKHGK